MLFKDRDMRAGAKQKTKGLKPENLGELQKFIGKLKKGEIVPFEEKTERARRNLRKAGLLD